MKRALVLLIAAPLFSCSPIASSVPADVASAANPEEALVPKGGTKGELFTFYVPNGISRWKWNWTSKLDFTGVSWNDDRTATLISPQYVVMAAHFIRPPNVAVMFHDKNGKPYERFISKVETIKNSDVAVGKLNLPLPTDIKAYRFASASQAQPGRSVFITDQDRVVSVHKIGNVFGKGIRFDYNTNLNSIYRRKLIPGDSGNPSFLLENGELRLLETHSSGGGGSGPNYSNPELQASIRGAIATMGN